jgi:hypothetical protein
MTFLHQVFRREFAHGSKLACALKQASCNAGKGATISCNAEQEASTNVYSKGAISCNNTYIKGATTKAYITSGIRHTDMVTVMEDAMEVQHTFEDTHHTFDATHHTCEATQLGGPFRPLAASGGVALASKAAGVFSPLG